MFTGIVEEVGRVSRVLSSPIFQLTIETVKVTETLRISDSVSTNGVCLTVIGKNGGSFEVQVMSHTLEKTNLGLLKPGTNVNLERALLPTSFLGGHFVTGDTDGLAKVEKIQRDVTQWVLTLKPPPRLEKYIVSQGRVTLQGVSLTVARKEKGTFQVCLIPHTLSHTTLSSSREGDLLNLEVDILAKYMDEILTSREQGKRNQTFDFLRQAGF